jgi:hypothetical protein
VNTGKTDYSGTGKSARKTKIVESYDSLRCLPVDFGTVTAKSGSSIAFSENPIFASFWNEFQEGMRYSCYFDEEIGETLFSTKVGSKPVGFLVRTNGGGHLVFLPSIPYDGDQFTTTNKAGEAVWTKQGIAFGNKLAKALFDLDGALRRESGATPPPEWTTDKKYALAREMEIQSQIAAKELEIKAASECRDQLQKAMAEEELLRALLYEKGKRLEAAILRALRIMGFEADEHDDGLLQLDQVISAPDGTRYIGESEGKDNSAINIDKFRQLNTNIQEDFEREGITEPARGILFGNAERLKALAERGNFFTEKCFANAKRTGTALIRTPDLFRIVKYIQESGDAQFAAQCRAAIKDGGGTLVAFPSIPDSYQLSF